MLFRSMLVRSMDQGKSWEMIAQIPGKNVKAIFPSGETGIENEVVVFTDEACVYVNEKSRQTKRLPIPVSPVIVVEGGRGKNGTLIYIQAAFRESANKTEGGMYLSTDLGKSWIQINQGLQNSVAEGRLPAFRRGLAVCETEPEVAYISVISPEKNEKGGIDQIYCIYKTSNSGTIWESVLRSSSPDRKSVV